MSLATIQVPKPDDFIVDLIRPNMDRGPWIAGGAALSWHQGNPVGEHGDIDVFCIDGTQLSEVEGRLRGYNDTYSQITTDPWAVEVTLNTKNAKTISFYSTSDEKMDWQIQLIRKTYYRSAMSVLTDFDFTCCQIVTDGKQVLYGTDTLAAIAERRLSVNRITPSLYKRTMKYWVYGYQPDQQILDLLSDPNPVHEWKIIDDYGP